MIKENGPWAAGVTDENQQRVFIQSDDFTHDVRLYVDGDFESKQQRLEYAKEIARRLNGIKELSPNTGIEAPLTSGRLE